MAKKITLKDTVTLSNVYDGASAYVHIAWADDAQGTNISKSKTNDNSQPYMGICSDSAESDDALRWPDYAWTKIAGIDAAYYQMVCTPTSLLFDADSEGGTLKDGYDKVTVLLYKIVGGTRTQLESISPETGVALRMTYGSTVRNITNNSIAGGEFVYSTDYNGEYLTKIELLDASTSEVIAADYFPHIKDGEGGDDAVAYRLMPSLRNITFKRDSDDALTPSSVALYCGYIKTVGEVTTAVSGMTEGDLTDIDGKYNVFVRVKTSSGKWAGLAWLRNRTDMSLTVLSSTSYGAYQFLLTSSTSTSDIFVDGDSTGDINYDYVIDVVDVPVIKEAAKGAQGLSGCIQRTSEWHEGVYYQNDSDSDESIRYIDSVWEEADNVTGYQGYVCKVSHTADATNKPGSGAQWEAYWTKINSLAPISTPFLYAGYSLIKFMQGNQLLMQDESKNIVAGMQGVSRTEGGEALTPLWVGGVTPNSAPFTVAYDGTMKCKRAQINGYISSPFHAMPQLDNLTTTYKQMFESSAFYMGSSVSLYKSPRVVINLAASSKTEGVTIEELTWSSYTYYVELTADCPNAWCYISVYSDATMSTLLATTEPFLLGSGTAGAYCDVTGVYFCVSDSTISSVSEGAWVADDASGMSTTAPYLYYYLTSEIDGAASTTQPALLAVYDEHLTDESFNAQGRGMVVLPTDLNMAGQRVTLFDGYSGGNSAKTKAWHLTAQTGEVIYGDNHAYGMIYDKDITTTDEDGNICCARSLNIGGGIVELMAFVQERTDSGGNTRKVLSWVVTHRNVQYLGTGGGYYYTKSASDYEEIDATWM